MNDSPRKQLLVACILVPSATKKFNHFYLRSTAVSKCWHGAFRTGLIIFRSYDGHVSYLINLDRQIFAEHYTAVGQQETALSESPIKKNTFFFFFKWCSYFLWFNCFQLFLPPVPLGAFRAEDLVGCVCVGGAQYRRERIGMSYLEGVCKYLEIILLIVSILFGIQWDLKVPQQFF